jgi:hypothetical protein
MTLGLDPSYLAGCNIADRSNIVTAEKAGELAR